MKFWYQIAWLKGRIFIVNCAFIAPQFTYISTILVNANTFESSFFKWIMALLPACLSFIITTSHKFQPLIIIDRKILSCCLFAYNISTILNVNILLKKTSHIHNPTDQSSLMFYTVFDGNLVRGENRHERIEIEDTIKCIKKRSE